MAKDLEIIRLLKLLIATVLLILIIVSTGYSFDGTRKGFVEGFGGGFGAISRWSISQLHVDVSEIGIVANGFMGYNWNGQDMIVAESFWHLYKTSSLREAGIFIHDSWVYQFFTGVKLYHYWGIHDNKIFSSGGVGLVRLRTQYTVVNGYGFGYTCGVGCEVFKHVQVSLNYTGGHTSNNVKKNADHNLLNITVMMFRY